MNSSRRDFLKAGLCASGLLLGGFRCHAAESSEVGKIYGGWREGELDIHVIYTGLGESVFYLFPDGTSMLIDAGDQQGSVPTGPLPDASRDSGEWIARYVRRVNPAGSDVDYMMLSHYHPDHGGLPKEGVETTTGRGEDYALSGLALAGEFLHFDRAFDRGYPDYAAPVPVSDENKAAVNFRRFSAFAMREMGLAMEKFEPGVLDQIRLQKDASYDFHIRNLSANGVVWTGAGTETRNFLADLPGELLRENPLSLSIAIQYGAFRYYTGGDLDTAIRDEDGQVVPIEAAVGRAAGPVDVCKANHHTISNASTDGFVQGVQARAYLSSVRSQNQPHFKAVERLMSPENYTGPRDLFSTVFSQSRRGEFADRPWNGSVSPQSGHIVVKVSDSGSAYRIYYLTPEDESMRVRAVYGPFTSTGTARFAARRCPAAS